MIYEARGFTSKQSPIKECECGHVWRLIPLDGDNKRIDTIKQGGKVDISHKAEKIHRMSNVIAILFAVTLAATQVQSADNKWYIGDEHCQPPKDDGTYSAPYDAKDHPNEYPTFYGADKPGWSCSYKREDGVIVQYGDSRTPQQQWMSVWGGMDN